MICVSCTILIILKESWRVCKYMERFEWCFKQRVINNYTIVVLGNDSNRRNENDYNDVEADVEIYDGYSICEYIRKRTIEPICCFTSELLVGAMNGEIRKMKESD